MLVQWVVAVVAALVLLAAPAPAADVVSNDLRDDQHLQHRAPEAGITVLGMAEGGARREYHCPARFIRMGNSCYFMSTFMASWHDAHFKCRGMGAQLAAFEKRWENRNMRKYLMREELAPLARWIGGIYQWEKRFWMWGSTGLAVAYKAFPRRMVTRDWAWHCIALDPTSDYHWRPASCLERKHYICEKPLRRTRANANRTRGQGQGRGRGAETKQHKGPRRKPGQDALDKDERPRPRMPTSIPDRGTTMGPAARFPTRRPAHHPPRGNETAASVRRLDANAVSRPPSWWRNRTRYPRPDRPYNAQGGPHARAHRPPPPPPRSRPSDRAGVRYGGAPAATDHQVHLVAYKHGVPAARAGQERARGPSSPSLGQGHVGRTDPRHRYVAEKPFVPEMPDATVQALYPPASTNENNDFSNDV